MVWFKREGKVLTEGGKIAISVFCCCGDCCGLSELSKFGEPPNPFPPVTFQAELIAKTGDCDATWNVGDTAVLEENSPEIWDNEFDPLCGLAHFTLACGAESSEFEVEGVSCPDSGEKTGTIISVQCDPFELVMQWTVAGSDLVCHCEPGGGTFTVRFTRLT